MSVGRGWAQIEADLRRELAAIGVETVSTYQKYGWLRADPTPWSEAAQEICDRAKARSENICEVCGTSPAERHRLPTGWIQTMCARHREGPMVRHRLGQGAMTCEYCDRAGRQVTLPGTTDTAVLCHLHYRGAWHEQLVRVARSGADLSTEPVHVRAAVEFLRSEDEELDLHAATVWAEIIGDAVKPQDAVDFVQHWFDRVRGGLRRGPGRFTPREQARRGVGVPVPWPITSVESRGGTWVRVHHRDGVVADHDLSYLLTRKAGAFEALTPEIIATAQLVDGDTLGFQMPDGSVLGLAPDAIYEHTVDGRCTGSCGWKPERTVVILGVEQLARIDLLILEEQEVLDYIEESGDGDPHAGITGPCPDCGGEPES